MYLREIELRDFRSYGALNLKFHNKVNIFIGENAQGKTNLLEAIYLTSLGKSFRTSKDSELIRFTAPFCRVAVQAEKDGEPLKVEIAVNKEAKGIKVDGVKLKKTAELLENIYVVLFSPEDLKIVKDDPEKRRRFINTELSQISPPYYSCLVNYRKALKQRNALLKDIRFFGRGQMNDLLAVWNEKLAEYGSEVMIRRAVFLEKLSRISCGIHENISGGRESLKLSYDPGFAVAFDSGSGVKSRAAEELKAAFLQRLKEEEETDIKNGTTSTGPHKDDIKIDVNGIDIRHFGSQGQQRTAALAMKLAELSLIKEETGEDAILLLDDVLSELDSNRQQYLISSFGEAQLFITTTELTGEVRTSLPPGRVFKVAGGRIEEEAETGEEAQEE